MSNNYRFPHTYGAEMIFVVLLPLFFISFCFLYDPFKSQEFFEMGGKSYAFHFLMMTCIIAATLAISRLIFNALYKHFDFSWLQYGIWCVGEMVTISLILSLYTALFYGPSMTYIVILSNCLKLTCLTLIFPYGLLALLQLITNMKKEMMAMEEGTADSLIKFYDEHKRLKMTIAPSAILYMSAEANYVKIHYLENGREREYQLRNSMKSLEGAADKHGLVRCHRSYYVNPKYIKVLTRNKEGFIIAELNQEGTSPIPVSKQYYGQLANLL